MPVQVCFSPSGIGPIAEGQQLDLFITLTLLDRLFRNSFENP